MTVKPFKPFPLLAVDERFGDYQPLNFATEQERDLCWEQIQAHYGIKEAIRSTGKYLVIPKPITGKKSRYFRESGLNYARSKAYKTQGFESRNSQNVVYRIAFSGNLSHDEANALIKDCWGDNWPR